MRKIEYIIVHCTATPEGREVSAAEVTRWHIQRGFRTIGYHYLIGLNGGVEIGRQEEEIGAHAKSYNTKSIGVCYVGGTDDRGRAKDTRTPQQKESLLQLLKALKKKYPDATIIGHRDVANKACPSFEAKQEYHKLNY